VSVQDVEHLCVKIFEERFSYYSSEAFATAKSRVEEFAFNYLSKMAEKDPSAIENLADPGVQSALLEAESGFAKTGDENLGEVLVSMLVERTRIVDRNPRQLAYNEALNVVQKLTPRHLSLLSLIFFVRSVNFSQTGGINWPAFLSILRAVTEPVCQDFNASKADVQYLLATGCCTAEGGGLSDGVSWGYAMLQRYPGLFTKGVRVADTPSIEKYMGRGTPPIIVPKIPHPYIAEDISDLSQVNAISEESIRGNMAAFEVSESEIPELMAIMNKAPMNVVEIESFLRAELPHIRNVLDLWQPTGLQGCTPSIIGVAIAHSNLKRVVPSFNVDIDLWIN
jgi:hypothetical protein